MVIYWIKELLYWRGGDEMKSKMTLESKGKHSSTIKPAIFSAPDRLTREEIDSLRRKKKQLNDYGLKAFKDRVASEGKLGKR